MARKTPFQRFIAKFQITDSGCWIWTGSRFSSGYGQFWYGRSVSAHRVAYEFLVGPIPPGMLLDHLCSTPLCVNPGHLEPVTNEENLRRWIQRNGGRHGKELRPITEPTWRTTTPSERTLRRRRRRAQSAGQSLEFKHGVTGYSEYGCRCEICTCSAREASRRAYERRRESKVSR